MGTKNIRSTTIGSNLGASPRTYIAQIHQFSVQGTVDLWSYIMPIDRYSHTL